MESGNTDEKGLATATDITNTNLNHKITALNVRKIKGGHLERIFIEEDVVSHTIIDINLLDNCQEGTETFVDLDEDDSAGQLRNYGRGATALVLIFALIIIFAIIFVAILGY